MKSELRERWIKALAAGLAVGAIFAITAAAQPKRKKPGTDDLVKQAQGLLDDDDPAPTPAAGSRIDAGVPVVDAGVPDGPMDAALDAALDAGPGDAQLTDAAGPPPDAAVAAVAPPEPAVVTPPAAKSPRKPRKGSSQKRNERIEKGQNVELKGAENSPLAAIVPPAAVPVVAAAATAAAVGFWPFLMKTLLALLKGLIKGKIADKVKSKGKEGATVDLNMKAVEVGGVRLRPRELVQMAIGSLVFGVAIYYTMFGFTLNRSAMLRQEFLVILFSGIRLFVRFTYERTYGIVTQYRFWYGGGVICLASAFFGNCLNTVGFQLNTASSPEDKRRMQNLSIIMIFIYLGLATLFFLVNRANPTLFFQAALVASSGSALSDTLPIAPMSGANVWARSKLGWLALFSLVMTAFMLFNFIL